MSIVKRSSLLPTTSFFDDFLTRDLFDWSNWANESSSVPRANILESDNDFRVELAAPGYRKEDFQVKLDNDTLTIQTELSETEPHENMQYQRREFGYHAFKRSFYLPNTVEADKIEATYRDGILQLMIPKKEEAKKKPARTIAIS